MRTRVKLTCNHHEDRCGTNDGGDEQRGLVEDVEHADVGVNEHRVLVVGQQVDDVGHGGWHPSTTYSRNTVIVLTTRQVVSIGNMSFHSTA